MCMTVKPDDDLYCVYNFKLTSHTSQHGKSQCYFYVPVTVHREQSVKKEYRQDATI